MKVTPEFKPKQFKAYRVPQILKVEIDRQIDELLNPFPAVGPETGPPNRMIVTRTAWKRALLII